MALFDIYLPFRGKVQFDETGDWLKASGVDLVNQRFARRLYTNPIVTSSSGETVFQGDDPFNQTYGRGLGRRIDSILEANDFTQLAQDARGGMSEEELVDQAQPVNVNFLHNPVLNAELMLIQYTLREGTLGQVGFGL